MNVTVLEIQRARKRLEAFCRRRNAQVSDAAQWCLIEENGALLIRECSGGNALLRLCFRDRGWYLFVPAAGDNWRPYPPRPKADTVDTVIGELEQAPLHIHW